MPIGLILWRTKMSKNKSPYIVIADLDGTIALIEHRRHWLDKDQHTELSTDDRWRNFFADCANDQPNEPVIETLRALEGNSYHIIIFSGRSNEVRTETEAWLSEHFRTNGGGPIHDEIKMRNAGDFTPDEELKLQWLGDYDKSEILCVFDDRRKVVDMWRAQGLTVFQVAPGEF